MRQESGLGENDAIFVNGAAVTVRHAGHEHVVFVASLDLERFGGHYVPVGHDNELEEFDYFSDFDTFLEWPIHRRFKEPSIKALVAEVHRTLVFEHGHTVVSAGIQAADSPPEITEPPTPDVQAADPPPEVTEPLPMPAFDPTLDEDMVGGWPAPRPDISTTDPGSFKDDGLDDPDEFVDDGAADDDEEVGVEERKDDAASDDEDWTPYNLATARFAMLGCINFHPPTAPICGLSVDDACDTESETSSTMGSLCSAPDSTATEVDGIEERMREVDDMLADDMLRADMLRAGKSRERREAERLEGPVVMPERHESEDAANAREYNYDTVMKIELSSDKKRLGMALCNAAAFEYDEEAVMSGKATEFLRHVAYTVALGDEPTKLCSSYHKGVAVFRHCWWLEHERWAVPSRMEHVRGLVDSALLSCIVYQANHGEEVRTGADPPSNMTNVRPHQTIDEHPLEALLKIWKDFKRCGAFFVSAESSEFMADVQYAPMSLVDKHDDEGFVDLAEGGRFIYDGKHGGTQALNQKTPATTHPPSATPPHLALIYYLVFLMVLLPGVPILCCKLDAKAAVSLIWIAISDCNWFGARFSASLLGQAMKPVWKHFFCALHRARVRLVRKSRRVRRVRLGHLRGSPGTGAETDVSSGLATVLVR